MKKEIQKNEIIIYKTVNKHIKNIFSDGELDEKVGKFI